MADAAKPAYVEVAVPLPLEPLTYSVPAAGSSLAVEGVRARVRVGKRRLLGVVVGRPEEPPAGVKTRPIDEVVDERPVVSPELIELARFAAGYYLASLGEMLRTMVPASLAPVGDRRVWLRDAGALAEPRDEDERRVIEALREAGRTRLSQLQSELGSVAVYDVVRRLEARGRVGVASGQRRGARYRTAVEIAPGTLEEHLEACGRSRPGREVVAYVAALGRPATQREVTAEIGCGAGVVQRLVKLGVLRKYTEIEPIGLGDHRLTRVETAPFELRADQRRAVDEVVRAVERQEYAGFHLAGVAGAGKTEIYLRATDAVLAQNRGAILLVPEIALVPALAATLRERYGRRAAILHSALSGPERSQEWERIRDGEAQVVLGPRSAIFAPLARLGLVAVDEEQDASYKQDINPRYNGRDLALVRASRAGAVAMLVSATPSLETRLNVERGKLERVELTGRVGQGEMPEGILVDLREEEGVLRRGELCFSARLREELELALGAGRQVILLRNRRGYAPVLLCRACGEDLRCDDCGLPRTLHKRFGQLLCHYCGSRRPVPEVCATCGERALEPVGAGTERVEEAFSELFEGVTVATLDRDTLRQRGGAAGVLERFRSGEVRVLVGTQMVSKGHHFPEVALTAVLQADTYLGFPDFRAVERTYSMLSQLAGRAGRGRHPGKVIVQTFSPEHYAIRAALSHDDAGFAREEMRFRRVFHYPPYTRMIQILLRDGDRGRVEQRADELAGELWRQERPPGVRIAGPAPAPFEKLRGKWRFQIILRGPSGGTLKQMVRTALERRPVPEVVIDVDPYELL